MIQSTVLPEIIHELNDLEDLVSVWRQLNLIEDYPGSSVYSQCADELADALTVIYKKYMASLSSTA